MAHPASAAAGWATTQPSANREELHAMQADGTLARLDTVFSRDGGTHRYVQDRLQAEAATLRQWIDDGATILVCGSLQGMAPAVDAVIEQVLGVAGKEALLLAGPVRHRPATHVAAAHRLTTTPYLRPATAASHCQHQIRPDRPAGAAPRPRPVRRRRTSTPPAAGATARPAADRATTAG
ncbi:hypothetical protein G6F32_013606 [Rhizopus arrhizus]|nr:hypothetical protein G6F32_013606 [Rhizopus arrhizus]